MHGRGVQSARATHVDLSALLWTLLPASLDFQSRHKNHWTKLAMSSLDLSLWHDVPLANRPLAVEHLWGQQSSKYHFPDETSDLGAYFDSYFKYYARQCDLIGRHDNGEFSSVETHRHIMDIVQLLRQPLRREEVRKQMSDLLRSANITRHEMLNKSRCPPSPHDQNR